MALPLIVGGAIAYGGASAVRRVPGCTHFVPIDDHEKDQPEGTRVPSATENVPRDRHEAA